MLALGLNSGSSFDGIDAVLVDIEIGEDGLLRRPRFIAGNTVAWPHKIAEQILRSFENDISIFELWSAQLCRRRPLCRSRAIAHARDRNDAGGSLGHRLRRTDDL